MTTSTVRRDWKVTTGYRNMLRIAWGMLALAAYAAVVAVAVGAPSAWWMAGGLAAASMAVAALLPEPVPKDLITEARSRFVDARRPGR
jgi:ABC-type spermidine/putrescine transport system permease subunit I